MKLKDIADMHDYLETRCYCPGEIYDYCGIFCKVYHDDDECELLCEGERGEIHGTFVTAGNQILYFEITDGKIDTAIRLDATDNNKDQLMKFMSGETDSIFIDAFDAEIKMAMIEETLSYAIMGE